MRTGGEGESGQRREGERFGHGDTPRLQRTNALKPLMVVAALLELRAAVFF
jgi:hypothetical protein